VRPRRSAGERWRWLPLLALLTAGCNWPGKPNPDERPVSPEYDLTFVNLFKRNCAGCHGADGTLGPAPPLNDPLFRAAIPEKELENVISMGRPGTPMPAFAKESGGTLSAAQVRVLIYEIKGIRYRAERQGEGGEGKVVRDDAGTRPKWGEPEAGRLAKEAPPYLGSKEGARKAGDRGRGAKVFARACAMCHGKDGKGSKEDDRLVINDPAFLSLISEQALRRIAITGRADLGMPNYKENSGRDDDFKPLTSEEITDLVAFLTSWKQGEAVAGK
jgi:mono/diheme cytochrome c family protein